MTTPYLKGSKLLCTVLDFIKTLDEEDRKDFLSMIVDLAESETMTLYHLEK